jgi:hypothetical protein
VRGASAANRQGESSWSASFVADADSLRSRLFF